MFVEDEISKNIPRLIELFESILSPAEKIKLENLENDEMGANGQYIREVLENNPVLEVFDTFTEALEHITNLDNEAINNYDLFIFDRNLTEETGYVPDKIRRINQGFDDVIYYQREGDFLAYLLLLKGCDIKEKVFFYSAYNRMKFALTEIDKMIDYNSFFKSNFHDKGNSSTLKEIISSKTTACLIAQYGLLFNILEKNNINAEKALLKLFLNDIEKKWEYDIGFRSIFDSILSKLKSLHDYWFKPPENNDSLDDLIKKLHHQKVPKHVMEFMDNIRLLINQYAAHTKNSPDLRFQLSQYTYRAMLNSILEIINWFGSIS